MPHGTDGGHEIAYAGTAAFAGAVFRQDAANRIELAQAGPEPIDVPRPGANQTVTVTVVTGRPLKLAFPVDDVKGREIVRDDLVLDFDNGGKVVLKDYMHAFGQLGEHRTTIIRRHPERPPPWAVAKIFRRRDSASKGPSAAAGAAASG